MALVPAGTLSAPTEHPCLKCGKRPFDTKRCGGCNKVWYCDSRCQKYPWVEHIFDCKPKRPVNTADHLALAVYQNLIPQDRETRDDYGFTRVQARGPTEESKLLGLYIGFMQRLEPVPKPIQVHRWRLNGSLVAEIKKAFETIPANSRGGYYPWFLQNQHVLEPVSPRASDAHSEMPSDELNEHLLALRRQAWRLIGMPPNTPDDVMHATVQGWPEHRFACFQLYTTLLGNWHPSPWSEYYIPFGFCAAESEEAEMALGAKYRVLIDKCTFDEFCAAYQRHELVALFRARGLASDLPAEFEGLVRSTSRFSVWDLKQFVLSDGFVEAVRSIEVDYGFMNARDDDEVTLLRDTYRRYFLTRAADAVQLHDACIQGRIYEHVDSAISLKSKKMKRLMKNMYPLA